METKIGNALRTARTSRGMSLSEVGDAVGISAATLSRIETEKQGVDVEMLITLSRILRVSPADMLDSAEHQRNDGQALVSALAALPSEERARVVVAAGRQNVSPKRSREHLQAQLDALLTTIDLIRDELRDIQRQAHRRRR